LDEPKINRILVLTFPDLTQRVDELIKTSVYFVENICDKLTIESIFEIISLSRILSIEKFYKLTKN
jgi:hypothetical protein